MQQKPISKAELKRRADAKFEREVRQEVARQKAAWFREASAAAIGSLLASIFRVAWLKIDNRIYPGKLDAPATLRQAAWLLSLEPELRNCFSGDYGRIVAQLRRVAQYLDEHPEAEV